MMEQRTNASGSVSHVHNRHGLRAILPPGWRRSDFFRPRVALAAILYRPSAIQAADNGAVVESLPDRGLSTSNIRDASTLFVWN